MPAARLFLDSWAVERAVPWLAALVVAVPVLAARYPPMIDLPCHEEIVAAMRYFGDTARYPPGLMTWNLGHPNQLFYFLACALALVLPVGMACKVIVAASVAGVALAAGRLADYLGASRWVAVSVAPLGLGFFFYFGFVGNLLGLGLLIASMPVFDRLAGSPTARRAGEATVTLLLLYEAHDSAIVIGGLAIVVLSLGRPLLGVASAWRMTPLAIGACLAVVEQADAMRHFGSNLRALPRFIDLAFWQKIDQFPQAILGLHGAATTWRTFVFVVAPGVLLAVRRMLRPGLPLPATGLREWVDARRFELLGVLLIGLYFEVPFGFAGAMWLHARFLTPGVALLVIALAPRLPARVPMAARVASILSVLAVLALVRPELAATGALYSDLDALLERIAPGSAIAPLDLSGGPRRGLVFTVSGAAARASAARGGRMAASFTQTSPIPAVIIAPGHRWEDSLLRIAGDSSLLEPSFDLHRFRYVLTWTVPDREDDLMRALGPEARLIGRSGGWLLFESTLAVESLLSAEPTSSHQESVQSRLEAFAKARRESSQEP